MASNTANPAEANFQAPLTVLVAAWISARDQWADAVDAPEANNLDTPACEFWRAEMERFEAMIETTPVRSQEDASAMIRYIWIDADADTSDNGWPQVKRTALKAVRDWASA